MNQPRQHYQEKLARLAQDLAAMGDMVEQAIVFALHALTSTDQIAARSVIAGDSAVNEAALTLDGECVSLIATEQPVARDLRVVVATLRASANLERIGDYGVNIARASLRLTERGMSKLPRDIQRMADAVTSMLHEVLECVRTQDAGRAEAAALRDAEVDALYSAVAGELLSRMSGEHEIDQDMDYLFSAKRMERIADHLINLCEHVLYIETGEHRELH